MSNDPVNHPSHYNGQFNMKPAECINITQWLTFCLGNAVKYIWRCGDKNKADHGYEDFKKALWYLNRHVGLPDMAHYTGSEGDARLVFGLLTEPSKEDDPIGYWKYWVIFNLLQEGEGENENPTWIMDVMKGFQKLADVMVEKNLWPEEASDVWSL